MKKLIFCFCVVILVFNCVSCNQNILNTREVEIEIPRHPWENETVKLWYSLKWNNKGNIESVYIDSQTRAVRIQIPKGDTVYICAYPLGEMLPFGTAVTPADSRQKYVLTQNEGYVAHLLINSDLDAARYVNFEKLVQLIENETYDFRRVSDSTLIADVVNGKLGKDSIEIVNKIEVPQISIPNGFWISEWETENSLNVTNNHTQTLQIPPGVHRYYNRELDREFRVVVEASGDVFHSLRYGMIGL